MKELIQNYKEARASFITAIDEFPITRREEVLFDKWNVKDVFTHLNGWDEFLTKAVRNLKTGLKDEFPAEAEGHNEHTLSNRKGMSWDEVYTEFENGGVALFTELEALSEEDWNKPLWSNNGMTAKDFLEILIGHINEEHLPLVKKFI